MDGVKGFLDGLGAVAETVGFLHDRLIDNGFTREEACDICGIVIATMFKSAKEKDDE